MPVLDRLVCVDCSGELPRQPKSHRPVALCADCRRRRQEAERAERGRERLKPLIDREITSLLMGATLKRARHEDDLRRAAESDHIVASSKRRSKHRIKELESVVTRIKRVSSGIIPAPTTEPVWRLERLRKDYEHARGQSGRRADEWGAQTRKAVARIVQQVEGVFKAASGSVETDWWSDCRGVSEILCVSYCR